MPLIEAASLWLMPVGETGERLTAWIDRLARRFGTERFAPHVTLLSGLSGEAAALEEATRRVAATLARLPVHLLGVEGSEEHFRCLYLRAVEAASLTAAHARAATVLGHPADPAFLPHLSLVYGRLPLDVKHDLAAEAGADPHVRFEACSLYLWSTAGSVSTWREVAAVALR
jgi:2'-5' RNA ligase